MDALFIELPMFQKYRDDYLDDDLFRSFQLELLKNPESGNLIEETGGLRKIRFCDQRRGKGKRSGLRVIYYWWSGFNQFWLFTVYGKDEQTYLSAAQKNLFKQTLNKEINTRSHDET
ncbi:toxin [Pseudomonas syringae]|nr:toxin [Pseudomonas syringae]MCF5068019.1 toxin [Pseudomonas syringae]